MPMELAERQALLAQPINSIIAIERPGHAPIAVPVWHGYEPGGDAWVLMMTDSEKGRLLRAAGRGTLVVQDAAGVRYAAASCELVQERPATAEEQRALAVRYLGAEGAEVFLATAAAPVDQESVFVLRPVAWRSADLSGTV